MSRLISDQTFRSNIISSLYHPELFTICTNSKLPILIFFTKLFSQLYFLIIHIFFIHNYFPIFSPSFLIFVSVHQIRFYFFTFTFLLTIYQKHFSYFPSPLFSSLFPPSQFIKIFFPNFHSRNFEKIFLYIFKIII